MASSRFVSFLARGLLAVVILLIAFSIVSTLVSTKPTLEVAAGKKNLPAVVVLEAEPIKMSRRTVGYGTADALKHADVPTRVSSTVEALPATTRAGRYVSKGDLLVALDDTDFRQQVIRSEQSLASAKAEQAILAVERAAANERAELASQDQILAQAEFARIQQAFDRGVAKQREVDAAKQKVIGVTTSAVNYQEAADRFPAREEQASSTIVSREADLELARES
ncbi:MAG: hypothetical protein QF444_06230, partial [Phycisphaerales bacterium]|nr:hypothetical protein [Phycisphaerales bacterium]